MKLSKPFIMISVALFMVWTAWNAQGTDLAPQIWLPEEIPFSNTFTQPSPVFRLGYDGANPGVTPLHHPSLKLTMKETSQQALTPVYPPTSVWTYKIKAGGSDLLTHQSSFRGYFWDASGRIKNTTGKDEVADLAYTFGSATPHIYLGRDIAQNNDEWRVGEDNNTRMMYGASIDYKVGDAFYVVPLFTYYDWGKQLNVSSKSDITKEWIGGLQFRFVF